MDKSYQLLNPKGKKMSKKILIADDDKVTREIIRNTLESEEARFEIFEAATGSVALEMAKMLKPKLILLDIMMPGMSGYDVCRALKGSPETKNIYVLFLTGRGGELTKNTIENCGGDDYMTKPFDPKELQKKIKRLFWDDLRYKNIT